MSQDPRGYRPNVAALLKRDSMILLAQRIDPDYQWQLPQGGIDPGESPEQTLWRELYEELGLEQPQQVCRILAHSTPISYDFPKGDQRPIAQEYCGQTQTVFLVDYQGGDELFKLDAFHEPEFRQFAWFTPPQALRLFWDFKAHVLAEALRQFAPHFPVAPR